MKFEVKVEVRMLVNAISVDEAWRLVTQNLDGLPPDPNVDMIDNQLRECNPMPDNTKPEHLV